MRASRVIANAPLPVIRATGAGRDPAGSFQRGMNRVSYRPGRERMPRQLPPLITGPPDGPATGVGKRGAHPRRERAAALRLLEAARDHDQRLRQVALDDLRHEPRGGGRRQHDDEQVHLRRAATRGPARSGRRRSRRRPA